MFQYQAKRSMFIQKIVQSGKTMMDGSNQHVFGFDEINQAATLLSRKEGRKLKKRQHTQMFFIQTNLPFLIFRPIDNSQKCGIDTLIKSVQKRDEEKNPAKLLQKLKDLKIPYQVSFCKPCRQSMKNLMITVFTDQSLSLLLTLLWSQPNLVE